MYKQVINSFLITAKHTFYITYPDFFSEIAFSEHTITRTSHKNTWFKWDFNLPQKIKRKLNITENQLIIKKRLNIVFSISR